MERNDGAGAAPPFMAAAVALGDGDVNLLTVASTRSDDEDGGRGRPGATLAIAEHGGSTAAPSGGGMFSRQNLRSGL
ncbi:hypothetical protein Hanom_Chr04g00314041 [Helianthus anomalus]